MAERLLLLEAGSQDSVLVLAELGSACQVVDMELLIGRNEANFGCASVGQRSHKLQSLDENFARQRGQGT